MCAVTRFYESQKEKMMGRRLGEYFKSDYFKASDFPSPRLLVVASVSEEEIGPSKDQKLVVHFEKEEQAFVLNQTNAKAIATIAGTDDLDEWPGTEVVLFASTTDFRGEQVECVRCRAPKGKKTKVEPPAAKHAQQVQNEDTPQDDCPF
jgi:hypothetical protein